MSLQRFSRHIANEPAAQALEQMNILRLRYKGSTSKRLWRVLKKIGTGMILQKEGMVCGATDTRPGSAPKRLRAHPISEKQAQSDMAVANLPAKIETSAEPEFATLAGNTGNAGPSSTFRTDRAPSTAIRIKDSVVSNSSDAQGIKNLHHARTTSSTPATPVDPPTASSSFPAGEASKVFHTKVSAKEILNDTA